MIVEVRSHMRRVYNSGLYGGPVGFVGVEFQGVDVALSCGHRRDQPAGAKVGDVCECWECEEKG